MSDFSKSSILSRLPTLAEQSAVRKASPKTPQKGAPPRVAPRGAPIKKARPDVAAAEARCRAAVWKRDQSHSRASGLKVEKGHPNEHVRGEVAHLVSRSLDKAQKYSTANCVLLTAEEHRLSDRRTAPGGKVLLKIRGRHAGRLLTFTRYDTTGRVVWSRQSAPPPKESR